MVNFVDVNTYSGIITFWREGHKGQEFPIEVSDLQLESYLLDYKDRLTIEEIQNLTQVEKETIICEWYVNTQDSPTSDWEYESVQLLRTTKT